MSLSTIFAYVLEHMSDETGYSSTLDFFYLVNRQQRCSARFDLHVWSNVLKNTGNSKADIPSNRNFQER